VLSAPERIIKCVKRRSAEFVDRVAIAVGFLFAAHAFWRDRRSWQRLADVEVPNGLFKTAMMFLLVRQRRTDRALAQFDRVTGELGTLIGTRWKEGDERDRQMVELTASVRRLTRWLVALTVVLGALAVASLAATIAVAA
jgi:hypothetical protein